MIKKITKHIPFVVVVNKIEEVTECLLNISAKIQSIKELNLLRRSIDQRAFVQHPAY